VASELAADLEAAALVDDEKALACDEYTEAEDE